MLRRISKGKGISVNISRTDKKARCVLKAEALICTEIQGLKWRPSLKRRLERWQKSSKRVLCLDRNHIIKGPTLLVRVWILFYFQGFYTVE